MAVLDVAGLIVELPAAFAAAFLAVFFAGILLEWLVLGSCLDVVFLADKFQWTGLRDTSFTMRF